MAEEVKLVPVEIIHADEPVMEIRLANGSTIRARLIITAAFERVGKKDEMGNPMIQFTSQVVAGIVATKSLSN